MQFVVYCFSYLGIVLNYCNSLLLQIAHFPLSSSLTMRNNRSSVSHSFLLRSCLSTYERNNGLAKSVILNPVCRFFFTVSSNFPNQQNCLSFIIVFEVLQTVNKTSAVQGVSSNSNYKRLS